MAGVFESLKVGGGKDKKAVVLEHILMLWHILRTFVKKIRSLVNNLPLQPAKSKFDFLAVFRAFYPKCVI